ncbi:CotH kinase family protein [Micromonospora sp. C28SCA-DRY-2]|uniref:CotH kinase family protein n=1 Tax=Micromonospora sp. C28SCA-DRY-2 TaxID=3059522 RepID=UPI00267445B5|nr:CotH kinase family protein [Micromonospora sp. C28SCA-DRY-2]MDO3702455.1 CotH kinase family protein [Micromonospora sp. C28SCA-DRY-2]
MQRLPRPALPRRLRRRIPVRVRQNWRLLTTCVAFLAVLTLVLGTERIRPYVAGAGAAGAETVTVDLAGTRDLFDAGASHSISLTFRDADYQRMLETYWKEGEKEYVEADLVVDGTSIPSVGIRLKGNSTLGALTWNGETRPRQGGEAGGPAGGQPPAGQRQGARPQGVRPPGGAAPDGAAPDGTAPGGPALDGAVPDGTAPDGAAPGGAAPGVSGPGAGGPGAGGPGAGGPGAGGPGAGGAGTGRVGLKAEEPETLPWLISFDEFVEGRRYQGHREVAVRVGGMGGGSTVLNEALSLSLLDGVGETTQRYAYSSFTVNDRPTTARLLVEHPDEHFAERLAGDGVLYKALAGGSFTDQGDDPTEYQDDFKQITMRGSQDLQPVINLIRWVHSASDEEFAATLAEKVDVRSFARYVALQNLLLNFDDMAGPGRNYYLWYDLGTKKFSVLSWDHNLTFSGNATQGPHDSGGPGLRGPGRAPGDATTPDAAGTPGTAAASGTGAVPDAAAAGAAPDGGRRGGAMGGHRLKERFLASAAFTRVYEDAYRELFQEIYGSGRAGGALDAITTALKTVDGVDAAAVDRDAGQLRTLIQQRTASLRADEVVTGGGGG